MGASRPLSLSRSYQCIFLSISKFLVNELSCSSTYPWALTRRFLSLAVEGIFGALKSRYGDSLRRMNRIARRREIGLRAVCRNINAANRPGGRPS